MRPDRDPYIPEDPVVFRNEAVIDRNPWIVDGVVPDAKGIGLRRPAEVIDCLRPVPISSGIELVDRDHLTRLRLGQQILVVEAPPGGRIAAEGLAFIGWIAAFARLHVEDPDLDDIARRGSANRNRTGTDVNAEPFSGPAAMDRRIHRPGAAPVNILAVPGPVKHALRAGIALDHPRMIIIG